MQNMTHTLDLAFPRWKSSEFVNGAVQMLGLLGGVAMIGWALLDAVAGHRIHAEGREAMVVVGFLLICYMCWLLRDVRAFMRTRLLVDSEGIQLDDSRVATFRWSEIARFEVSGPGDVFGVPCAGAVMHLRDGRRVPLRRLDHLGGDGRNSERAIAEITERVATMNRLLAEATAADPHEAAGDARAS